MSTTAQLLAVFAAGVAAGAIWVHIIKQGSRRRQSKEELGAIDGDDGLNSLYYTEAIEADGKGLTRTQTCDDETLAKLRRVDKDYRFLPKEFYGSLCEQTVITCVDVIVQRSVDKKLLLFYRRDPPASKIWWWPGGRLFRGESFGDAALRKVKDETGGRYTAARAKGIVTVWNTFFPDSAWDKGRSPDRTGTQTMNVVVVCVCDETGSVAQQQQQQQQQQEGGVPQWAVERQQWVSVQEAMVPGAFDKYVRLNVKRAVQLGLL